MMTGLLCRSGVGGNVEVRGGESVRDVRGWYADVVRIWGVYLGCSGVDAGVFRV